MAKLFGCSTLESKRASIHVCTHTIDICHTQHTCIRSPVYSELSKCLDPPKIKKTTTTTNKQTPQQKKKKKHTHTSNFVNNVVHVS